MVGRIYVVNHYTFLHTKYRRGRLHGCRRFFKSYSPLYSKSMEANDLQGVATLDPRVMVGMIYVGVHPTLL